MKERPRGSRRGASYARVARRIAESVGGAVEDLFGPAEETDVDSLVQLGLPDSVLAFYRELAPVETIERNGVSLWDIAHILDENHNYSPGAEVHELGYVVVAGNRAGDVYCLDLGESHDEDPPRVVLLPHRVQLGARDRSVVERQAQAVAESFDDFLLALAEGELSG
jgi:hypothetical protein